MCLHRCVGNYGSYHIIPNLRRTELLPLVLQTQLFFKVYTGWTLCSIRSSLAEDTISFYSIIISSKLQIIISFARTCQIEIRNLIRPNYFRWNDTCLKDDQCCWQIRMSAGILRSNQCICVYNSIEQHRRNSRLCIPHDEEEIGRRGCTE